MTTSTKLYRLAAAVLAAGGFCWVLKFVVIAATDGAESGAPDTITSILWITAVSLMVVGTVGLGVALTAGRHPVLRVLAGIAGFPAWVVAYIAIEAVAKAVVGEAGPSWMEDEVGIVATGAVLMTVGLLLARSKEQRSPLTQVR